ncbi:hypothetical protein QCE48_02385 [Caballeronia sp. LZ024]|nr:MULTISPECIES: hypothetical protein [unclassified Caballeronia]MDR5749644.1 hypothetical protein [Caballeronia sp. LZ024]MDR5843227.1 hypothetical protein [Caballeronia sp. LZ031]
MQTKARKRLIDDRFLPRRQLNDHMRPIQIKIERETAAPELFLFPDERRDPDLRERFVVHAHALLRMAADDRIDLARLQLRQCQLALRHGMHPHDDARRFLSKMLDQLRHDRKLDQIARRDVELPHGERRHERFLTL